MQYAVPSCQLPRARTGDSRLISPLPGGTEGHDETALTAFRVADADQWLTTTTGRIAPEAYSWMQAVHWIAGSGLYDQAPGHGPKWGPTTVRIAQEIAALTECRPSVDYLARKLSLSPRTVKYHLAHLRAAGLLVYRSKGTRLVGRVRLASVYERVIPAVFDEALGIRTVLRDETAAEYTRVPVGIAEEGRKTIGDLARKAARKIRAKRTKRGVDKSVDRKTRCTPMQVGTSAVPSTGSSSLPSEEIASGKKPSPTPKQQKPKARKTLNAVGRRYQLARELTASVPWLGKASVARIAWIARHVADAGWTCDEVRAFLAVADVDVDPRRPSGFLAARLKAAPLQATKKQRQAAVEAWHWAEENARKARIEATRRRRDTSTETVLPQTALAQRQWSAAIADTADRTTDVIGLAGADDHLVLEDLTRETVRDLRAAAELDHGLIHAAFADGMSETDVRRLYTHRLVDLALRTPAAF